MPAALRQQTQQPAAVHPVNGAVPAMHGQGMLMPRRPGQHTRAGRLPLGGQVQPQAILEFAGIDEAAGGIASAQFG
jgi:hypothetical protein